jgi:S1-C subfamily serine protease
MLIGNDHACTGFQIQAPSGKPYLLTAGHCKELSINDSIEVITEAGNHLQRRIIAADTVSDLLLLEPVPSLIPFQMASKDFPGEYVRVVGHGYALPLWEVSGSIIGDHTIVDWLETIVSAPIAPGHSGSPALDVFGHVLGVASTGNGQIGGLVRLQDVLSFLKGY